MSELKHPNNRRDKINNFVIGVAIAVCGGLIVAYLSRELYGPSTDGKPNPSHIVSTSFYPPSSSTEDVMIGDKPEGISAEPVTTPSTYAPHTMFVTDRKPIVSGHDVDSDETASLDGKQYLHSITHQCHTFCDEATGIVEYDLNKEFSTFTADIGVSQHARDASQVGIFVVYVDNEPKGTWQVAYGQPTSISVDVSGGVRLKLESAREGTVDNPAQAGANSVWGVSNGLPDLVWGSPQLSR